MKQSLVKNEKRYQIQKNKMVQLHQETQIFMNKDLNKNFTARKRNITHLMTEKEELQLKYQSMMKIIKKFKL